MILVYIALAIVLGAIALVVNWRAKAARLRHVDALEGHGAALAQSQAPTKEYADHVARQLVLMDSHRDYKSALSGQTKWDRRATTVNRLRSALKNWRGRKAPYVVGALDALGLVGLIDLLGLHGQLGESIIAFVKTLFTAAG